MPSKDTGSVSKTAFRVYIAIIALVVGILAYLIGQTTGEMETKYEASQRDLENQKEVYTNDLLIEKDKPNTAVYNDFRDWMYDHL